MKGMMMNILFYGVTMWESGEPPCVYFGQTETDLRYIMGLDGNAEVIQHDKSNSYTLYRPNNLIIEHYAPKEGIWRP